MFQHSKVLILVLSHFCLYLQSQAPENPRPNVIMVMTDDQGFGDLGYYGNPHVKTPTIDAFARESVRFDEFIVSPVCAPTRAALMTGRHPLRTGVRDTYRGGAIMSTNEITLAEMLKQEGYATGMVGKWHLGDNYPSRPQDQGFDFTLRHLSGGIGQPGDWPNTAKRDSSYFNPVLWKNGEMFQSEGYCSDVFTDVAIDFIDQNKAKPFFLYLAYNAPHAPLQVPQKYYDLYKDIDPASGFENDNRPFPAMNEKTKEQARKVYAMVSNIDDNLKRLFQQLDDLKLSENTLVIFMTDNGPQHDRYIAGMRGRKSYVYEGGVRVPSFWRLPSKFMGNRDINTPAAHYDILPTLAELCRAKVPTDRKIDGTSLLGLLSGRDTTLENRSIVRSWVRGGPEKYNNISIRNKEFKLVGNCDGNASVEKFELYDLAQDPYELTNLATPKNKKSKELKTELDQWLDEMFAEPNFIKSHPAIIGTVHEPTTVLNLNDGEFTLDPNFNKEIVGWAITVAKQGNYTIKIHMGRKIGGDINLKLTIGSLKESLSFKNLSDDVLEVKNLKLSKGSYKLTPLLYNTSGYLKPFYIEITPSS
ncbi:arylsulfatase [Zobellia galactanivorans]|uniref:Sulfatase, family S1-17 n=1 Tax=Zobellia galactanivorans (strain DSM 12802 / CCUG 47099 / CIP 106680 / NCIMB 13871 / Dsij) TaxID=63186 RepID=G0L8L3_ZOBGA|nr:arylsulfatase [Zobellia galactanivorans]CAZ97656.1 Sulfatase, family S1-17 [Zobellia galactanivorans]